MRLSGLAGLCALIFCLVCALAVEANAQWAKSPV
jgi:hypothetical protein